MDGTGQKLESLLEELSKVNTQSRLSAAVEDVDKIIELLSTAREQVAESLDTHTASLTITKLQNPIKTAFDKVNDDLKAASSAHKKVGRSLDKNFPLRSLPTENDTMAGQLHLIDRAIAMHLLREGQFSVASTFINEADANDPPTAMVDLDEPMDKNGDGKANGSATPARPRNQDCNVSSLQPQELQEKFTQMYQILQELKTQNLVPAIEWARDNSAELEARGSNLEFELSRLQYVWLFKGPAINGLPDDERNGRAGALAYARQHFGRFQARHLREIQELASAMVFAPNLSASPYGALFATDGAFADVSASFTREFCSLLGLSAESPLHLAVTAGALALPQLIKYQLATRAKRAEWTTLHEMPFETPLPQSMLFHNIFVCPVSKEQTTTSNPPMVIPCGHLLANETLKRLAKGNRFKCPYCPSEGHLKDARRVNL